MQVGRMIGRDLFGGRKRGLGRIEQHLLDMLDADRHTLELATTGLLGSADPEALHHEVSDSDHRVNLLVQRVRRELVVHASLRGTHADISAMFATMSVVKDIERVGDYAKHLLRIARIRGPFVPDSAEHVELAAYSNRIARYATDVRDTLGVQDPDRATALIIDIRALTDDLNTAIDQLLTADPRLSNGAAQALAYHYLARTAAHLSNVLTSIVMPLDKLDFYDEPHRTAR